MKKKTRSQQDPAQTEQEKVCIFRHILLGACVLFTVLMLLLFIVLPDNSFSEMENRSLEGIPSFDRTDLLNGSGYGASVRLSAEEFYTAAKDADFLIYNATIESPV